MKKTLLDLDGADVQLSINRDYAAKLEYRKKKEELSNAKTAIDQLEDELETTSESEDEDGLLPKKVEDRFKTLLPMLAAKNEKIYDPNAKFFPSDEEAEEEGDEERKKKKEKKPKPYLVTDYIRETLLKDGATGMLGSDDDEKEPKKKELTHVEEQQQLKKALIEAGKSVENGDDADDGGLFSVRKKSKVEKEKEQKEDERFWEEEKKRLGPKADDILGQFWLKDDLDDDEKWLRNYIWNNGWTERDVTAVPTYAEIVGEEDEEALEKQEEFEHNHQQKTAFRYLEEGAHELMTFPREIPDSVRRKSTKRAEARQRKQEKKEKEKKTKQEELKRLKNLVKQKIDEQLEKIREISGANTLSLDEDDLEGEFDPEEHDRKMQSMFDDEFYSQAEDKKPKWNDDDLGEDDYYDAEQAVDRLIEKNARPSANGEESELSAEKEAEKAQAEKQLEDYLQQYYSLHYEDLVAGEIPCRFKYAQVKPSSYGLSIEEILEKEDRELNRHVSLKQLAPYREKQNQNWKRRERKRRRRREEEEGTGDEEGQQAGGGGEHGSPSKGPPKEKEKKKQGNTKAVSRGSTNETQWPSFSTDRERPKSKKRKLGDDGATATTTATSPSSSSKAEGNGNDAKKKKKEKRKKKAKQ